MQNLRPKYGFRIAPKYPLIEKMTMTSQFFRHDIIDKFFWRCFVSLVKFNYWSKFHVNIITRSRNMTIFFYKGLIRNPEIGNTSVWVLPNIWRMVLCEICLNTEFFLVRIFQHSHSVRMLENTDQKKLSIWALFTQCAGC